MATIHTFAHEQPSAAVRDIGAGPIANRALGLDRTRDLDAQRLAYTLERMSAMSSRAREVMARPGVVSMAAPGAGDLADYLPPMVSESGAGRDSSAISFVDDSVHDTRALRRAMSERVRALGRRYRAGVTGPARRVVVMGAGPIGMRCAIGAALAGHRVTVIEQRGSERRARYLGLFAPEQRFLADLGAPRSMFVEARVKGVAKRLLTIADLQTFLVAVARQLGVTLCYHTRAIVDHHDLACGRIRCREDLPGRRRHHVDFDVLVDATGARSRLRQFLIGRPAAGFRTLVRDALAMDGDNAALYQAPDAPLGAADLFAKAGSIAPWREFVARAGQGTNHIFDDVDCFVANIDSSIFRAAPPDLTFACPPDWIWVPFPRSRSVPGMEPGHGGAKAAGPGDIFRIHFEGPLPRTFRGRRPLAQILAAGRAPVDLIAAYIHGAGASSAMDRHRWLRYCELENGCTGPAHNAASLFSCRLSGIRTRPDAPSLWGQIPGSHGKEYFVAGDAALTPWYRFGVGIMDGFYSAAVCDELWRRDQAGKRHLTLGWERYLRMRAVQVMYSLYLHEGALSASSRMRRMLDALCSKQAITELS